MRCFVAINLPDEVKNYLEDIILKIEKENSHLRAKWSSSENLHLTLGFIEEIDDQTLGKLATDLETLAIPNNFILSLGQLGVFPNNYNPRIIKLDLNNPQGELRPLYSAIKEIFEKNNIPADNRPFFPHITLARLKSRGARVRLSRNIDHLSFVVNSVELIKSELTPAGPIYTILQSYK